MGHPVVHFEIIGNDPAALRSYYGDLFGWEFDTSGTTAETVSEKHNYGFVDAKDGIPGGVGGGTGFASHTVFYVGVPDVDDALRKAESLGGTRTMDPITAPNGTLRVAQFTDPEGNLIGLAGPPN